VGAPARLLSASAIHGPMPGRSGAGRDTPTGPLRILFAARTADGTQLDPAVRRSHRPYRSTARATAISAAHAARQARRHTTGEHSRSAPWTSTARWQAASNRRAARASRPCRTATTGDGETGVDAYRYSSTP